MIGWGAASLMRLDSKTNTLMRGVRGEGWDGKEKNKDELGGYPTEDLKYAHAPKLSRGMVPYLDHRRRDLKLGLVDGMRERGMGERGIGAHGVREEGREGGTERGREGR